MRPTSRTKNQPKEEVFWTDVRGSFARISRPKTSVRAVKILEKKKNKHFGADIHDPKARTSTTLRDFQKFRSEKLWANFSFPNSASQKSLVPLTLFLTLFGGSVGAPPSRLPQDSSRESSFGILLLGGERGGGEPGICDGRMPLSTG